MEFRKAEIADIPFLVELRKQQLLDEGSSPVNNIDDELISYFTSSLIDESLISWLAIDNERIIATSGVCFYRLPPNYHNPTGWVAYITNMFTLNEYRKQGIASTLLKLVIDEAKSRNYRIIRLHASSDGKSIYSKFGFVDSKGYMALYT